MTPSKALKILSNLKPDFFDAEENLIKIPEDISADQAAAILLQGMTVEYLFERLYKIKKNELLEPINFNKKVNKGDVIAKLNTKTITAPFGGVIGKRGISGSSLGSENTIILTLDDSRNV